MLEIDFAPGFFAVLEILERLGQRSCTKNIGCEKLVVRKSVAEEAR
jgi:hypothetical protein